MDGIGRERPCPLFKAVTRFLPGRTGENQEILSRGGLQADMNLGHPLDRSVRFGMAYKGLTADWYRTP